MKNTLVVFVLTIIIAIISIQIVQSQDSVRNAIALECIAKVGIDKKIIQMAIATTILPRDDEKYKEFLSCSYKKQGYQDENGEILIENLKTFLKTFYNSTQLALIEPCKNTNATSHPEIAFNALDCILAKLKKIEEK